VPASVSMLEGSLGAALEQEPVPAFEQASGAAVQQPARVRSRHACWRLQHAGCSSWFHNSPAAAAQVFKRHFQSWATCPCLHVAPAAALVQAPLGTRRVVFLSGMYAAEVMETISAFREAGALQQTRHGGRRGRAVPCCGAFAGWPAPTCAFQLPGCQLISATVNHLAQACLRLCLRRRCPTTGSELWGSWCKVGCMHFLCCRTLQLGAGTLLAGWIKANAGAAAQQMCYMVGIFS